MPYRELPIAPASSQMGCSQAQHILDIQAYHRGGIDRPNQPGRTLA